MEIVTRLDDGKWTEEKARRHREEMFNILENDMDNTLGDYM